MVSKASPIWYEIWFKFLYGNSLLKDRNLGPYREPTFLNADLDEEEDEDYKDEESSEDDSEDNEDEQQVSVPF